MSRVRGRLSSAHVIAIAALFVALSGSAYAALRENSVGTKQLKPGAVEHQDLAADAVTSGKVEDGTLAFKDFAENQLPTGGEGTIGPVGPAGPQGERGLQGVAGADGADGANGSADTPQQVLDKLKQVDGSGSGIDADTVDGMNAAALAGSTTRIDRVQIDDLAPGDGSYETRILYSKNGIVLTARCAQNLSGGPTEFVFVDLDAGSGGIAGREGDSNLQQSVSTQMASGSTHLGAARSFFALGEAGTVVTFDVVTEVNGTGSGSSDCAIAGFVSE